MRIYYKRIIGIVFLLLPFFFPNVLFAQEAKLANITVTNTRDDLLLFLNVEGAFRKEMKKAIYSGVPTTFSYLITLHKSRNFWFDKTLADREVTHTIKYNNLKKEFIVKQPI